MPQYFSDRVCQFLIMYLMGNVRILIDCTRNLKDHNDKIIC